MDDCCNAKTTELTQLGEKRRVVLIIVLILNLVMFLVESAFGWLSHSTSLMADSLDMLGDAFVYAISIYALGRTARTNALVSLFKGIIMLTFGIGVILQAVARLGSPDLPIAETIGVIGGLALAVNLICATLLLRHRNDNLNMRSVWLCSRNDVIANIGVLGAGGAVALTQSKYPDILVGVFISVLVLRSAFTVLRESIKELKSTEIIS